jgi:NitT/TauT family transport system substrate-binding protein
MSVRKTSLRTLRRPMGGVVAALLASCAMVGCSGSDDEPAAQGSDAGDDTISVAFQPATESLAVLSQLNAFAGGFFEDEGLDVTYNTPIPNAAQAAQSVTTSADIAIVGSTGVLPAIAAGRDVVSVAVITKGPTTQVTLRDDVIDRLGVDADAPIDERVEALEGLTLALPQPGSTTDVAVRQALSAYGIDADEDMTIRPITEPSALVTAMREEQVDGFAFSPPTSVQPVAEGYASVWLTLSDVPELQELPWIDVVTSKSFLEENPEAVERFLRALVSAANDLEENADEAQTRIKDRWFPDLDQSTYDLAYELSLPTATQGLEPSEDGFDTLLQTVNDASDEDVDLGFDDVYDLSALSAAGGGN